MIRRSLLAVLAMLLATPAPADSVTIVTEEFPPYDFVDQDGRVAGVSTEVVREVLGEVGIEVEIDVLPWARAYKLAVERPGTMLFSVVRTAERESQFHWVGVVCDVRSYLYRLRSRSDIAGLTLDALKDHTVGVVRGWAGERFLLDHGFSRLEAVADSDLNIKKLLGGRVDLIEDYEANVVFRMRRLGLDPALIEKVHFNDEISGPLYAVFNRATPDAVVDAFRAAFDAIHEDGRYAAIQARWVGTD